MSVTALQPPVEALDLHDANDAQLYRAAEAGELWGCSEWTIRRWISSGLLPAVDIRPPGGKGTKPRLRVRHCDLVALANQLAKEAC